MNEDYSISWVPDTSQSGQHTNGPSPSWVTVTHGPTQVSARAYGFSQAKARELAMTCCKLMVEETREESCSHPENLLLRK